MAVLKRKTWIAALALALLGGALPDQAHAAESPSRKAAEKAIAPKREPSPWADFVEQDFPFFSSALDARSLGTGWPTNNLTPRGLILNLGHGAWACFDTDLLRVSAIWTGAGVSPVGMAQGSYHVAGVKALEGQTRLPQIVGTPWLVNGIYPGWQIGREVSLTDPREPGPNANEVGRGPLDPALGRFKAVRLTSNGVCLEYEVAGVLVREWIEAHAAKDQTVVQRRFRLERVSRPLMLIVGQLQTNAPNQVRMSLAATGGRPAAKLSRAANGLVSASIRPAARPVEFGVVCSIQSSPETWMNPHVAGGTLAARWPQTQTTSAKLAPMNNAYVVDNLALPLDNPWKRNVRLADLAFFNDGRAAAVTFDGDVWMISGLNGDLQRVTWRRFTSGLHEPLTLAVRDEELFVFDRNGIWRLRDTDQNGEAEVHELFANCFAQTAETREFATGMRVAPDGAFILSKGGQQSSTIGIHNGTVLRVSPDGRTASVLGWGLRMPFIGVHPKTGLVTASDQQGHYIPTTPLHIIRDRQYYGFLATILPKEKYPAPITDALTWIPHPVNASAASQVWLTDAKMGPLTDALINIGYYRPELLLVLLNQREPEIQAAVVSLTRDLEFAPLNGVVNPVDGQLYVIGFQIWGTEAKQISGLARVRHTGAPSTLPLEVVPMDHGVLLRFEVALDPATATNTGNFSAERWMYKRTANYGSPHFKLDGTPGHETIIPASAYLSKDARCVFLGLPDMQRVMQMRVGWTLPTQIGAASEHNAYFTVHALTRFDPVSEGFEPITVDLSPKRGLAVAETPVTVEEGHRLATLMACVSCHSIDGTTLGKVGPTWKGLFGSQVHFADGGRTVADEAYLRESISEPNARIVRGFDKSDTGMPSYQGVITDTQVEALMLYIKSLR